MSDVRDDEGVRALTPDQDQMEWRVVPAEPTPKMITAAELAIQRLLKTSEICDARYFVVEVYRAMTGCLQKESPWDFAYALAYDVRWELPFGEPATDTDLAIAIKKTMPKLVKNLACEP